MLLCSYLLILNSSSYLLLRRVFRLQLRTQLTRGRSSWNSEAVADVRRLEGSLGLQIVERSLRCLHVALDVGLTSDGGIAVDLRLAATHRGIAAAELNEGLAVALLYLQGLVAESA